MPASPPEGDRLPPTLAGGASSTGSRRAAALPGLTSDAARRRSAVGARREGSAAEAARSERLARGRRSRPQLAEGRGAAWTDERRGATKERRGSEEGRQCLSGGPQRAASTVRGGPR